MYVCGGKFRHVEYKCRCVCVVVIHVHCVCACVLMYSTQVVCAEMSGVCLSQWTCQWTLGGC